MSLRVELQRANLVRQRFGVWPAAVSFFHAVVNKFVVFDRLHIIVLDRKPHDSGHEFKSQHQLTCSVATAEHLREMKADGTWDIDEIKERFFEKGDVCVLNYVDGNLAGYTWVHELGRPELIPGLVISTPKHYAYNWAGFTHPKFRGVGLQSYRHYMLLNDPRWKDYRGFIGYVLYTNWASRRGQGKSGYRTIGTLWIIGRPWRFWVYIPRKLRVLGVRRIGER